MKPFSLRRILWQLVYGILDRLHGCLPLRRPYALLFSGKEDLAPPADLFERISFYLPGWEIYVGSGDSERYPRASTTRLIDACLRNAPLLVMDKGLIGPGLFLELLKRKNPQYHVNPRANPSEAWEWQRMMGDYSNDKPDLEKSRVRLREFISSNGLLRYGRCYIFATGPSLSKAAQRSWSDGVRIVCNTIVRDQDLWNHLRPHFFVAADAAYHFGFTEHARAFRSDLKARLAETDALFLYPAQFHALVSREFADRSSQLVPIPVGKHKRLDNDLLQHFEFADLGNVLSYQLAVASTVSDLIYLWGFDGRAPGDKYFWANSPKHSYPELMDGLRVAYPAFFQHFVPEKDGNRYTRKTLGDELDECLTQAEMRGKTFVVMHRSWTPTLQKRFRAESGQPSGDGLQESEPAGNTAQEGIHDRNN